MYQIEWIVNGKVIESRVDWIMINLPLTLWKIKKLKQTKLYQHGVFKYKQLGKIDYRREKNLY